MFRHVPEGSTGFQQVPWGSWVLNVLFVVFELVASVILSYLIRSCLILSYLVCCLILCWVILSYLKWWVAGADCLLDIYK